MSLYFFVTLAMFACLSVATDENGEPSEPWQADSEQRTGSVGESSGSVGQTTGNVGERSGNVEASVSQDQASVGQDQASVSQDQASVSQDQEQALVFGIEAITVDEMFIAEPEDPESETQTEIRDVLINYMKAWMQLPAGEQAAGRDAIRTADFTCKYAGDDTAYERNYCNTIQEFVKPSPYFALIYTYREVVVNGNSATAHITVEGHGTVLGFEFDAEMVGYTNIVKEGDQWKISQFVMTEDGAGLVALLQPSAMKLLRDSIVIAKQQYPTYNPIIIISLTALAGFLVIAIVGVAIVAKRRSYDKSNTVAEV